MRGLAIAFCAAATSAVASADCPAPESLERYVETTRDALVALRGSITGPQLLDLENRYAAMVVLEWNQAGLGAIEDDSDALSRLITCFREQACGSDRANVYDAQLTDLVADYNLGLSAFSAALPRTPSDSMLLWAEVELECREAPAPENELDPDQQELEISSANNEAQIDDDVRLIEDMEGPERVEEETIEPPVDLVQAGLETTELSGENDNNSSELPTSMLTAEQARSLLETAAISIASGEIESAIPMLRESCLYDISKTQSSIACDTLLDVYEVHTLQGTEEVSDSTYLSFSEELCDAGYIQGCHNMALYLRAANTTGAYERGVSFTARACDLGDPMACATLASDHLDGRTERQNLEFARTTLQQSCDLGRLESCLEVADLYIRGVGGNADNMLAMQAATLACPEIGAENPDLCVSAADFVLINMETGDNRAMHVRTFIKRACDIGHGVGCAWYAEDLELGIGGRADPQRAREVRLVACEYGDQKSCRPRS